MTIHANNPSLKSWVEVSEKSDFPIQNLPFGIFKTQMLTPRVGVAIGEKILDLYELHKAGFISKYDFEESIFNNNSLNDLMALGKDKCRKLRDRLSELLSIDCEKLKESVHRGKVLVNMKEASMLMPVRVGDYTDFYSSIDHATNVGVMFRDPANALLPNWKHMPVGYHGRASSIVVSGTNIHRPKGQTRVDETQPPIFEPSKRLDFELEVAFIVGKSTNIGDAISTAQADDYIFGLVLFNDLSARDIQQWEYVPLGPFLGKNFGSVISPWVVTLDALEPYRVAGYEQNPEVLPYLQYEGNKNYDIKLEVEIKPEGGEGKIVSESNFKYMYWNMNQQLAHHTVNGCNVNIGDMMASGTISGPEPHEFGSMLEIAWKGTKPVQMPDGTERKFLNDHDFCIIRGHAEKDGIRIGFGDCITKILPAK
jgi:fumarylacetoacetase